VWTGGQILSHQRCEEEGGEGGSKVSGGRRARRLTMVQGGYEWHQRCGGMANHGPRGTEVKTSGGLGWRPMGYPQRTVSF